MHGLVFLVAVVSFLAQFVGGIEICKDGENRQLPSGKFMECFHGRWRKLPGRFNCDQEKCVPEVRSKRGAIQDPNNLISNQRKILNKIPMGSAPPNPLSTRPSNSLFPTECGFLNPRNIFGIANKVANGADTRIEETPWQIGIMKQDTRELSCGGSIVSKNMVLTAAHCFLKSETKGGVRRSVEIKKESRYIFAGGTSLKEDALTYNISSIRMHTGYNSEHKQHDIALLKIIGEFVFSATVQPICLPYPELYVPGRLCLITGWGAERPTSRTVDILKRGAVKIFSKSDCIKKNGQALTITDGMFCAGDDRQLDDGKERTDTCQGDSGGPLFSDEAGKNFILGITSWGIQCGLKNHPGVYTKVTLYIDWIETTAQQLLSS